MESNPTGKSTFTHLVHIGVVVRDMNTTIDRLNALGIGPFKPRILPPDAQEKYRGKPFIPSQRVAIQTTQIGNMELELIYHPHYGIIKDYELFGEELTLEGFESTRQSARLVEKNAQGNALAPTERMGQVLLPFL